MPGYSPTQTNIIDPENSTTILLAPFASFVGTFVDVQGYSSITFVVSSDVPSVFAEAKIEWSTDGLTPDIPPQRFTFDPGATSVDNLTVHATVRARFYRISYQNSFAPQTSFELFTLLRKGTPTGTVRSIDPVNTFITNVDVVTSQSILSGIGYFNREMIQLPLMDDVNLTTLDRETYIFVSPRPGKVDNVFRKTVNASLVTVQLTSESFTFDRNTFFSITNDVERGNLYIRLGNSAVTIDDYDYIIPPGHTWQDPGQFGSVYPGNIFGIWDEVYIEGNGFPGKARMVSHFYG